MAAEERIAAVNTLLVLHPRFRDAVNLLKRCHEDSRISAEPICGALLGASGVGKTTVIDHYRRSFPAEETDTTGAGEDETVSEYQQYQDATVEEEGEYDEEGAEQ